jgi:carbonyl reductase 1
VLTWNVRGIGLAIGSSVSLPCANLPLTTLPVRNLALQYPKSTLNDGPFLVYLTARDRGRGEAALQQLQADGQLKGAKVLAQDGGPTEPKYRQLDISDSKSIGSFAEFLRKEHPEGIDVLVNNAGIALDGFGRFSFYYGSLNKKEYAHEPMC